MQLLSKLMDYWQGRFQYGFGTSIGCLNINRYTNGSWVFGIVGPTFESSGTGHWPWHMFEAIYLTGPGSAWHVGLLGVTIGMLKEHEVDEEGMIDGPDKNRYFMFFKCINHYNQTFEEIIDNAN